MIYTLSKMLLAFFVGIFLLSWLLMGPEAVSAE